MESLYYLLDSNILQLNPFAIGPFMAALVVFFLGFFLLSEKKIIGQNKCLLFFNLACFFWLMSVGMILNAKGYSQRLVWAYVLIVSMTYLPATIFHCASVFTNRYVKQIVLIRLIYALALTIILSSFYNGFIIGFHRTPLGFFPRIGLLLPVLILFAVINFTLSFVNFTFCHLKQKDRQQRVQIRFYMMVYLILLLAYLDVFAGYYPSILPLGHWALLGTFLSLFCIKIRQDEDLWHDYARVVDQRMKKGNKAHHEETEKLTRNLQQAEQEMMSLSELTPLIRMNAGILHKVIQPVTVILGLVKFLKKEMDHSEEFYKPVLMMEEQSVLLKDLLSDLMALSYHKELRRQDVNTNACVEKVTNLLSDEFAARHVKVELNLKKDLPLVFTDPVRLQHIFMSIIFNAVEAVSSVSKEDRRSIEISTSFDAEGHQVKIVFTDNGPGIAEKDQSKVFDPFFTTKSRPRGVALTLTRDLIEEEDGQIFVKSEIGHQTSFVMSLPADTEDSDLRSRSDRIC